MTRALGSTGLLVTRIGLGLAALGRPAYINLGREDDLGGERSPAALEQRCHAMLDAAYAAGVRYIDAARSYGLAEAFVRSWLQRPEAPGDVVIASKWGYTYVGDWRMDAPTQETKDLSVETLRRQTAESRELLGDRLAIYQIHSATLESGVLEDAAVLRELARLREGGLVIGLTVTGTRQADTIRRAMDVSLDGANPFQVVQATWNLLEPSAGPALAEASASGWGVVIKEGLANGRLTDRGASAATTALTAQAREAGVGVDTLALAAILSQPWVDVALSGAVTPAQLASNLRALSFIRDPTAWPNVAEPTERYWSARAERAWI